jgi:hypothetical protein
VEVWEFYSISSLENEDLFQEEVCHVKKEARRIPRLRRWLELMENFK